MEPSETRWATLWAALQRLQLEHGAALPAAGAQLSVHLVGADHREGRSFDETFAAFRGLSERLAADARVQTLRLALVGPNVARALHGERQAREFGASSGKEGRCRVEVRYFVGSFDEFRADERAFDAADLAVAFNAGVWGYDEWRPALRLLLRELRAPLLVTSYNEREAADDEDVLDELAPEARWFWRAEKNPSGSAAPRETRNTIGSVLHENDFWMCLGAA